jgi:hypothetical protein
MKQLTRTLISVGVVSLASAVNAEEAKLNPVQTALSSTTLSGYVDTSINWNSIDNHFVPPIPFQGNSKQDGFNLNVVKLSLEKAMDESEWASGYKLDLLFGPDAVNYNASIAGTSTSLGYSGSDFGIKQAYVALRTPVGNGIDWKLGVFDSIIGYETFEAGNNPNFTRSYGYAIEPTQLTGLLGTYRITDEIAVAAGLANVATAGINARNTAGVTANGPTEGYWDKAYMASIAVTAPKDMGFLSGSTLYAGLVAGFAGGSDNVNPPGSDFQKNYYVGATINTPVTGLQAGVAFDYVNNWGGSSTTDSWALAGYLSYQASERLSFHGRIDYNVSKESQPPPAAEIDLLSLTATIQYDLWQNVISRLEVRWDQYNDKTPADTNPDSVGLYANFIYKF